MKTIFVSLIGIFILGCCVSKKNIEKETNQECNLLIENVKKLVSVDSLGQLSSNTLSIDDVLIKKKVCFIGLKESQVIETFGKPLKKNTKDEITTPFSLTYTYAENCSNLKVCKQVFFIFDSSEKVRDIKIIMFN